MPNRMIPAQNSATRNLLERGTGIADAPSGALALTDNGTATSDAMFGATFPYLATPLPGAQ